MLFKMADLNVNNGDTQVKEVDEGASLTMCLKKDCKHGRMNVGESIQCSWCMVWYHLDCVNLDKDSTYTIFSCPCCRIMPNTIMDMAKSIKDIEKSYKKQLQAEQKKVAEKKEEMVQLRLENTILRERVAALDSEVKAKTWAGYRYDSRSAVAGDSMIQDIDPNKLNNTTVHCHRGGRVEDLTKDLDTLAVDGPYENLTLLVGTNDIANQTAADMDGLMDRYKTLLEKATTIAQQVTVSSVLPRTDGKNEKVGLLNSELYSLCEDTERCTFVDNDLTFKLRDGSANDGYLLGDGHLSKSGTNKLVKNLNLKVKQGIVDVTKSHKNQLKVRDRTRNADPQSQAPNQTQGRRFQSKQGYNREQQGHNRDQTGSRRQQEWRANQKGRQQQYQRDYTKKHDLSHLDYMDYTSRCHFCFEEGHTKDRCRHHGPIDCHSCGYSGHKAKHCTY